MAKISADKIFKGDLFKKQKTSAADLRVEIISLIDNLKGLAKVTKKGIVLINPTSAAQIKELNKVQKTSIEISKAVKVAKEAEVKVTKTLKVATADEVREKLLAQKASKNLKDSIKDELILLDRQSGTLAKLTARNRALRRQRDGLNLSTEKGKKRLKEINDALDKNNKKIGDNSDKLKKQKLNVGNYTNSIKEAAASSGLFGGVLGKLTTIQATLGALTKKNTVETEVNTTAKVANASATKSMTIAQKGLTVATGAGTKALKLFKIALASTGIGVLLLALGGLVAFFKRSQDGVDSLSTAFAGLGSAVDVIIDRFAAVGSGIVKMISGIKNFSADEIKEGIAEVADAFKGIGDELDREIRLASRLKELTIDLTREQKLFQAEQATSLTAVKKLTILVKDKLQADEDRLAAVKEINEIEIRTAEKQLALQSRALAASLDSASADRERLELGAEQLDFIERIKTGQIESAEAVKLAADFTLSSAAGEEALFEIVQKIVDQEQARQSLLDKQATTAKRTASIVRDIATKQGKALIEEGKLRLLVAKDEKELIKDRIIAYQDASEKQIESYKVQSDANIINEREFNARRLEIIKITQKEIDKLLDNSAAIKAQTEAELAKVKAVNAIEQEEVNGFEARLEREIDMDNKATQAKIDNINKLFDFKVARAKEAADFETINQAKTDEERELIAAKLVNKLSDLENERGDSVKSVNEEIKADDKLTADERLSLIRDSTEQIAQSISDLIKDASKRAIEGLNDDLDAAKERENELKALAEQGSEDAINNLAFQAKETAKIEAEIAEAEKSAQIAELTNSAVKAFAANLDSGQDGASALGNTIASITALMSFIGGLSSFKDGTEELGAVSNPMDADGGRMIIAHQGERIMQEHLNMKMGGMSNENVANLVQSHNNGSLYGGGWQDNSQIIEGFDKLESAIKNQPSESKSWDPERSEMTSIIKTQNKIRRIVRPGGVR